MLKRIKTTLRRLKTANTSNQHPAYIWVFWLWLLPPSLLANNSSLSQHPSAYIAMHADDPVDWQLWQPSSLELAKEQNKLVFLSSGYFSCHWCHVMQQDNYQNPEIAQLLNKHFVSIKIDRELNPEKDRMMIAFAREHLGSAGWPQHVIQLPTGEPIAGFTYLPPSDLKLYLNRLIQIWQTSPQTLLALAKTDNTSVTTQTHSWQTLYPQLQRSFEQTLTQQIDDLSGGLQGSHKFPQSPLLKTLLLQQTRSPAVDEWLKFTLQQMQSQHLFDHINGGFYRYTVDPEWQTPHFEKMLYDNAQLLEVYALAAAIWQEPSFLQTAEQTLHYLREQLYQPQLQLYLGSQSALDNQGIEGGSYLWSRAQLHNTLSAEAFATVQQAWSLDSAPPYPEGWHPMPTAQHWPEIQSTLKHARIQQIPTDNKAILAWNGLLLSALNRVSELPQAQRQPYRHLSQAATYAHELAASIQNKLATAARAYIWDKQLLTLEPANLEDYAYVYQGLAAHLKAAEQSNLATLIQAQFLTPQGWRYRTDSKETHQLMIDDAVPSPTATLRCLVSNLTLSTDIKQQPLNYATYLQPQLCD